jgi:hypothetical protein
LVLEKNDCTPTDNTAIEEAKEQPARLRLFMRNLENKMIHKFGLYMVGHWDMIVFKDVQVKSSASSQPGNNEKTRLLLIVRKVK